MCIIGVASGCHPDFPLVCIHNREEVAGRPTSPCELRDNAVICAVDELKGGTWMGMNVRTGLFCSLTNLRSANAPRAKPASRGLLVRDLLEAPAAVLAAVLSSRRECEARLREATAARSYEGLNLCVGGWHPSADGSPPAVFYVSNVPPGANAIEPGGREWKLSWSRGWTQYVEQLVPGKTHAWSNNAPAAPAWPKSAWLQSNLASLLSSMHPASTADDLLAHKTACAAATSDTAGLTIVQETDFQGSTSSNLPASTAELLRSLCALLSTTVDFIESELPVPHFSPYQPWQEAHLQRGPFVRHNKRWASYGGTRSQTIIVADRQCCVTWYCYRETDSALRGGGGCGEYQEGGAGADATDHRLHVFGVPWPREAAGDDGATVTALLRKLWAVPCLVVATLSLVVSFGLAAKRW